MKYYFFALVIGFCVSGIWFGAQLWMKMTFLKKGWKSLLCFAPFLAALVPIILLSLRMGDFPSNCNVIADRKTWLIAAITLCITCLVKLMASRKGRVLEKRELALMCVEAAFTEIAQRLMMQAFVMHLLACWGCGVLWCIPINALIWCLDIIVQPVMLKQPIDKELLVDILASFVFSVGMGYVFFSSGCILIPMAAHAAERFVMTKADR